MLELLTRSASVSTSDSSACEGVGSPGNSLDKASLFCFEIE